jgi:hypothetical protein
MTAAGEQKYKPGDLLPVGHSDAQGWEWAEFIAADDAVTVDAEPVVKPEPVVEPDPEPVKAPVEPSAPVDF